MEYGRYNDSHRDGAEAEAQRERIVDYSGNSSSLHLFLRHP